MRSISVPLHILNLQDDGFHLLVEIVVFNEKHWAVLDTGASRSVFDQAFMAAKLPALEETTETHATTIFSSAQTTQGIIPRLNIGKLIIRNYTAVGLDLQAVSDTYQQMGHPPVTGIIGGDILAKYQAKIDYRKQVLRFYR